MARLTSSDQGRPPELIAIGWVATNEVESGQPLSLWISFENLSDHEIRGLHFTDFQAPGFRESSCFEAHAPACVDPEGRKLEDVLRPGESVTVRAVLQPAARSGHYGLVTVFAWSEAGKTLRKGLSLGPVEVTTPWRDALTAFTRQLHTLGKDLALPIVAVLITVFFNALLSDRAARRALEERALATRQQLLSQFIQDSQKYYLPIQIKVKALETRLREREKKQATDRECFYQLMSFLRQVKFLSDRIGGVQFQNKKGEDVFTLAWEAFRSNADHRLGGSSDKSRALDAMKPGENLAKFEEKFSAPSSGALLLKLEGLFIGWLNDQKDPFSRYLPLLDAMYWTAAFEMDRPLELWYGTAPEFPMAELEAVGNELSQIKEPAKVIKKLGEQLESYRAENGPPR